PFPRRYYLPPRTRQRAGSQATGLSHRSRSSKGEYRMGAKQLAYSDEARQKLLAGVTKLARAVRSTLGPRGRNAVLDKGWGSPTVTKDGVSVAGDMELKDPSGNTGARLAKEADSR